MVQPISKFQNGETLAEYRIRRKNSRKSKELTTKTQLRIRDGVGCRWPGCPYWKQGAAVHGAHLVDKGMGGDPKQIRTQIDLMMRLCEPHHTGPKGLHSALREIEFLTERRANGPCRFKSRKTVDDPWVIDGIEDEYELAKRFNPAAEEAEDDE